MTENMSSLERKHWNLAIENNNTYRNFIAKYGSKTIRQLSNSDPEHRSVDLFRGPDKDRYVLDPRDYSLIPIDMGHFFASAQAPFGLGIELGAIVEIKQGLERLGSAFQQEDYKANALGSIFGRYYLNNPEKGNTLKERLTTFFQDYQNNTLQLSAPLRERIYDTPYGYGGSSSDPIVNGQDTNGNSVVRARSEGTSNSLNEQFSQPNASASTPEPNSYESLAVQQNKSIEELIASNFSAEPGDPKYNNIFRTVLSEIKKENPDIDIQAIAKVASISLQQQSTL